MSTPLRIIIRPRAADDLEFQVKYLDANAGKEIGDRYLAAVNTGIERVAEMPAIGSPRDHVYSRHHGLRAWPVPGFPVYRILYRPFDDAVVIIRILHGSQDIDRILAEED